MAILGLPYFADGKFKKIERKVGKVIEAVATKSCEKWREEEKKIENDHPRGNYKGHTIHYGLVLTQESA